MVENRYGNGFAGTAKEEEEFLSEEDEVYVVEALVNFAWQSGQYSDPTASSMFDEVEEVAHVFKTFEDNANGSYSWAKTDTDEFVPFEQRGTRVHLIEFKAELGEGRLVVTGSLDVDSEIKANDEVDAIEIFKKAVEYSRTLACGTCTVEVVT